jgi:protease-4
MAIGKSKGKIALVPVKGLIVSERMPWLRGVKTPAELMGLIEEIGTNKKVAGVIFEIDSPGGMDYASKKVAEAVKNLKKPKVALIKSQGASGAYWIASACDCILADELSRVGSLGAWVTRLDLSDFLEKFGIKVDIFRTGEFKARGLPYEKPTEEEKELLKKELEESYKIFLEQVKKNRKMTEKQIKEFSQGKVYLGKEAKSLGLVDGFGDRPQAIETLKELAKLKKVELIDYEEELRRRKPFLERFLERFFS